MFNITSKYFSIFNNKPPARWVAHIARDFLKCYSCSYYSSVVQRKENNCMWKDIPNNRCSPANWVRIIFQGFCLNFKSTFTIFKEFISSFWDDFRRKCHDGCFGWYILYHKTLKCINIKILVDLVKITMKLILIFLSNSFFNSFMKMKNQKWAVFRFQFFM